jgi:hypothetical protein
MPGGSMAPGHLMGAGGSGPMGMVSSGSPPASACLQASGSTAGTQAQHVHLNQAHHSLFDKTW